MKLELDKARADGAKKWGIPKFPPTLDELLRETQAKTLEIAALDAKARALAADDVYFGGIATHALREFAEYMLAAAAALREGR